jgi:hypothetical protein
MTYGGEHERERAREEKQLQTKSTKYKRKTT